VEERWLSVYDLTVRNLLNYGKVKEAVSLLEQVAKIKEQTLAEATTGPSYHLIITNCVSPTTERRSTS
jgi:hypothetical protein